MTDKNYSIRCAPVYDSGMVITSKPESVGIPGEYSIPTGTIVPNGTVVYTPQQHAELMAELKFLREEYMKRIDDGK